MNKTSVRNVLGLPANEVVLYNMPVGHPTPSAFYNLTCAAALGSVIYPGPWETLPQVRQSSIFLDDTLMETRTSHEWRERPLMSQETLQILWSAYGLSYLNDMRPSPSSPYQHHIVASAGGSDPFTIWMLNCTGICLFDYWLHTVTTKSVGDKRAAISQATGAYWMASAPMILLLVLNGSKMEPGHLDWAFTEAGCAIQNVHLGSVAWGLVADSGNIVDEDAAKMVLGLVQQTDLHPITVITVGHPLVRGDLNNDGIVDIYDAIVLANNFNARGRRNV